MSQITCPDCEGHGRYMESLSPKYYPCPTCHGSGKTQSESTPRQQRIQQHADELYATLKELKEVVDDIASEQCAGGENIEYWNGPTGYGYQVANRAARLIEKIKAEKKKS